MSRHGHQQGHEFGYGDRYDRLTNYSSSRNDSLAYRSDGLYDEHYGRGTSSRDRNYDNRNRGVSIKIRTTQQMHQEIFPAEEADEFAEFA